MTSIDNPSRGEFEALLRRIRALETQSPLESSSVSNGRVRFIGGLLRVDSGGRMEIVGTLQVDGTTTVTGTFNVDGPWTINGNGEITGFLRITGPTEINGATTINGNFWVNGYTRIAAGLEINGPTTIAGATTLNSTLTIATGQILAGDVTVTPTGGGSVKVGNLQIDGDLGGTIRSPSSIYMVSTGPGPTLRVTGNVTSDGLLVLGAITAASLNVTGAKNFQMPHPLKPGKWLRHGSTESPVSGIEYWGEGTIESDGSVEVELPEYFEALAKPDNRTVFITGRGHTPHWSDIEDGAFTVTGTPGGRFSWLVKAERFGGDFLLEEAIPDDVEEA